MKEKSKIIKLFFIIISFLIIYLFSNISVSVAYKSDNVNEKKSKYIKYGIVIKDSNLYEKRNNEYEKSGVIYKDTSLEFTKKVDDYLQIKNVDNDIFFIKADNVDEIGVIDEEKRYKQYIVFNKNIITNRQTTFYDGEGNKVYTINKSFNLPIIINGKDKYGVEYNNKLLFISRENVVKEEKKENTILNNVKGIGVLNYHFFYDDNDPKEKKECNQMICKSISDFEKEINFLKENNILTITTKELEMYIDGEINLPESVLITIDDGWLMSRGIDLLEKKEMHASMFLITSWFDDLNFINNYKYIEFHSHGNNLHNQGVCPGGQGGGIKCLPRDELITDLRKSSKKLNNSTVFAYPFYEYNNYSIEVLQEAGYKMAFAGQKSNSDNLVHVGDDKYKLPRYVVLNYTTLEDLKKYLIQ